MGSRDEGDRFRHRETLDSAGGRFPDDAEVIFLYDRGDDCFGYAVRPDTGHRIAA